MPSSHLIPLQKRENVVSGLIYLMGVVHLHIRYVGVFPPTASSGNLAAALQGGAQDYQGPGKASNQIMAGFSANKYLN